MWDFVREMKNQGKIRNVGFSIHDGAETLDDILTEHPDMDFVQLQVNYLDWEDPVVQSRRCMEVAQKHGVPVIVMEPARGGRLIDLPARVSDVFKKAAPDRSIASWAYRFCYNLPNVITVLSGMSSIEHVRENVGDCRSFGSKPFSPEEQLAFDEAVTALHAVDTIACTNCRYCVKDCPQGIAIPNILGLLNLEALHRKPGVRKGAVCLAGESARKRMHRMRYVRRHVPAENRYHQPVETRCRAFRITGQAWEPSQQQVKP